MVPWGVPLMNWPDIWGSGTSWVVGVLSCGLRRARKGLKKTLSAWPQGQGCGKLKNIRPIRLEGVKRYSSRVSHFFTGRVRVLHGGCRSAPQQARFGSWALWWSAIPDMRAGAGQAQPGPSPPVPPVPPKPPAGCAGEPCRGQSWPGSHEHARAT